MPHSREPKPWKIPLQVHLLTPPSSSSSSSPSSLQPSTRLLFSETITCPIIPTLTPSRFDITLTDLHAVLLASLRMALSSSRRRVSMTERRRLNGLEIKSVWAWWNWDVVEREGGNRGGGADRGRRVKRMTRMRDAAGGNQGAGGNVGEVLLGLRFAEGAACLVVYAELPRAVRGA